MSDTLRVNNIHFGNTASNYNQPQMGFTSVGIGSTTNYGFLQFFGTSNTLCWTANGTVGIGTTAPTAALQVNGAGVNNTTTLTVSNDTNSNTGYGAQVLFNNYSGNATLGSIAALRANNAANFSSYMAFSVNTADALSLTERMRILNNGFVGISTGAPLARLTIRNGYADGDTGGFCIDASDGSVYNMRLSSFNPASSQVSYRFGVNNLAASLPNTLVLAYNGRVGIGKSVPTSSLDITGNLFVNNGVTAFSATEYQGLQITYTGTGATGYGSILATNPGATYNPLSLNPFGGNVGIGTAAPIAPLHVVNPSNGLTNVQYAGSGAQWYTVVGNYPCSSAGTVLTIPIVSQMGNWGTTMIRIRGFNGLYNTTNVYYFTAECVANTLGSGYGNFSSISVGGNASSITFNTTSVAVRVNFSNAYGSGGSIALVIEYLSTIPAVTIIPASISVN